MRKVYNRGFLEGYYLGRTLGEWTPRPGSTLRKESIHQQRAPILSPHRRGRMVIESGNPQAGDTLMITGPKCGMVKEQVNELVVNGKRKQEAKKGDLVTFPFATKVIQHDKLYKVVSPMHKIIHYRNKCIGCGICQEQQPERWRMSKKMARATLLKAASKKMFFILPISNTGFCMHRKWHRPARYESDYQSYFYGSNLAWKKRSTWVHIIPFSILILFLRSFCPCGRLSDHIHMGLRIPRGGES